MHIIICQKKTISMQLRHYFMFIPSVPIRVEFMNSLVTHVVR